MFVGKLLEYLQIIESVFGCFNICDRVLSKCVSTQSVCRCITVTDTTILWKLHFNITGHNCELLKDQSNVGDHYLQQ